MKITGHAKIRNRFDIVCKDIITGEEQKYQAHNIVLNNMFTRLLSFYDFFSYIRFGTGTGTLLPTRTSLFEDAGYKSTTIVSSVRELPTSYQMRSIVLQPEEHVGKVLTEVGVAYGTASTNLVTHAFIEDSEGNPIGIVKTDTMVVTIYATIFFELGELTSMYGGQWRWVMPLSKNELVSYLMGATYPTQRFRVTQVVGFGSGTGPSHGYSSNILTGDWTKDVANKRVTTPVRRLGVDIGNGKVRGFGLGSSDLSGTFRGQFPIAGFFSQHAIEGEQVGVGDGVTTKFNPVWDMITAATVYVDGVAVDPADVTIVTGDVAGKNVAMLLEGIVSSGDVGLGPLLWGASVALPRYSSSYIDVTIPAGLAAELGQLCFSASNDVSVTLYTRATKLDEWMPLLSGVTQGTHAITIPVGHALLRLTVRNTASYDRTISDFALNRSEDKSIFTFATPPAEGAVITADYTVPYIPKDVNHVLDLQCAIQWG